MATRDDAAGLPIGEVLKSERTRQRIDIQTVEEETKIRTKYLRALENEEWEVLPGHPYAKGFLRTYAQFLGLDPDALVDEYRRTVESSLGANAPVQFAEPVLERRRRLGQPTRSRWLIRGGAIALVGAAAAVGAVLVIGDSGQDAKRNHGGRGDRRHSGGGDNAGGRQSSSSKPVTLSFVTRDDMRVCLVPGHGQPLIDSQVLATGSEEGPFLPPADNYRLDLETGGTVTLTLDGESQPVGSKEPASFEIDSSGVEPTSFEGGNCR
jgi:transcriptional regulator with XRE-family HTH domain